VPDPSPSLFVEAPELPPDAGDIVKEPHREDTPVSLPDPHIAPPDAIAVAPLSPHELSAREVTPTPSIVVEPPEDERTPFFPTSTTVSRAESPVLLPDPHAASSDTDRTAEDVPLLAERAGSLSPSVKSHAGDRDVTEADLAGSDVDSDVEGMIRQSDAREFGSPEKMEDDTNPAEAIDYADDDAKSEATFIGDDKPPVRPQMSMTESMRLLHRHGVNRSHAGSTDDHAAATSHRRTRSSARQSISSQPPVTRSHCFYRKLQLNGVDMSACVLVPQCTLFDFERLEEEESKDIGEATPEDEQAASGNAMTEDNPLLHPHLALKLHRIVGKTIFDEGHCFLLSADEKATQPAKENEIITIHTPRSTRKRTSVDHDDETSSSQHLEPTASVTRARSVKRDSVARELASDAFTTPTKSPLTRDRGIRRSTSRATDDGASGEVVPEHDTPARRTRHQTRRSISVTTDTVYHSEPSIESREMTPVAVTVSTVSTTPSGSVRKSARKSRRGQQSPVAEVIEEEDDEREATPTRKVATTNLVVKPVDNDDGVTQTVLEGQEQNEDEIHAAPPSSPAPQSSKKRKGKAVERARSTASPSESTTSDQPIIAGDTVANAISVEDDDEDEQKAGLPFKEDVVARRKSRRLREKAKEDEASSHPGEDPGGISSDNEGEDQKRSVDTSPTAIGTRKRKARISSSQLDSFGSVTYTDADQTDSIDVSREEGVTEGRSSKRRAVASENDPDVPAIQEKTSDKPEEEDDDKPSTPVPEKKSKGWFSFWKR